MKRKDSPPFFRRLYNLEGSGGDIAAELERLEQELHRLKETLQSGGRETLLFSEGLVPLELVPLENAREKQRPETGVPTQPLENIDDFHDKGLNSLDRTDMLSGAYEHNHADHSYAGSGAPPQKISGGHGTDIPPGEYFSGTSQDDREEFPEELLPTPLPVDSGGDDPLLSDIFGYDWTFDTGRAPTASVRPAVPDSARTSLNERPTEMLDPGDDADDGNDIYDAIETPEVQTPEKAPYTIHADADAQSDASTARSTDIFADDLPEFPEPRISERPASRTGGHHTSRITRLMGYPSVSPPPPSEGRTLGDVSGTQGSVHEGEPSNPEAQDIPQSAVARPSRSEAKETILFDGIVAPGPDTGVPEMRGEAAGSEQPDDVETADITPEVLPDELHGGPDDGFGAEPVELEWFGSVGRTKQASVSHDGMPGAAVAQEESPAENPVSDSSDPFDEDTQVQAVVFSEEEIRQDESEASDREENSQENHSISAGQEPESAEIRQKADYDLDPIEFEELESADITPSEEEWFVEGETLHEQEYEDLESIIRESKSRTARIRALREAPGKEAGSEVTTGGGEEDPAESEQTESTPEGALEEFGQDRAESSAEEPEPLSAQDSEGEEDLPEDPGELPREPEEPEAPELQEDVPESEAHESGEADSSELEAGGPQATTDSDWSEEPEAPIPVSMEPGSAQIATGEGSLPDEESDAVTEDEENGILPEKESEPETDNEEIVISEDSAPEPEPSDLTPGEDEKPDESAVTDGAEPAGASEPTDGSEEPGEAEDVPEPAEATALPSAEGQPESDAQDGQPKESEEPDGEDEQESEIVENAAGDEDSETQEHMDSGDPAGEEPAEESQSDIELNQGEDGGWGEAFTAVEDEEPLPAGEDDDSAGARPNIAADEIARSLARRHAMRMWIGGGILFVLMAALFGITTAMFLSGSKEELSNENNELTGSSRPGVSSGSSKPEIARDSGTAAQAKTVKSAKNEAHETGDSSSIASVAQKTAAPATGKPKKAIRPLREIDWSKYAPKRLALMQVPPPDYDENADSVKVASDDATQEQHFQVAMSPEEVRTGNRILRNLLVTPHPVEPGCPRCVQEANRAMDRGHYRRAVALYLRSLKLRPDDNETRVKLAFAYHMLKKDRRALTEVDRVLASDPAHPMALLIGGITWQMKGDYAKALSYYTRYLRQKRDSKFREEVVVIIEYIRKATLRQQARPRHTGRPNRIPQNELPSQTAPSETYDAVPAPSQPDSDQSEMLLRKIL